LPRCARNDELEVDGGSQIIKQSVDALISTRAEGFLWDEGIKGFPMPQRADLPSGASSGLGNKRRTQPEFSDDLFYKHEGARN
jgi:hypothetical protein